ncbi:hypothetical protein EV385_1123 [Krasilnikovia cinnamomea]|uniref:Uncharacterized protein n=1 Tax=Krasilnikovia cinnamomea TaxID=349313 RepID=A0A4Q7ZGR0_9ACTN|nr:hypothetical protein [Krasilnikovia cinnamomea]RZU49373.1 hypothetical protein EV385_1123 [Krasilnikovia cinnamomea]
MTRRPYVLVAVVLLIVAGALPVPPRPAARAPHDPGKVCLEASVDQVAVELRRLNGQHDSTPAGGYEPGEIPATQIGPNRLGPGESYRRRVGADDLAAMLGWSGSCEPAVSPDAPDPRPVGSDTDIAALLELGLAPGRSSTVTLTARQWRAVLEPLDFVSHLPDDPDGAATDHVPGIVAAVRGRIRAASASRPVPVSLTGAQWVSVATELASSASIADEMAAEGDGIPDGSALWRLLDQISTRLGGPAHPSLGFTR